MVKTYAKKITAILTAVTIIFSMLLYFPDGTFSDISFGLKASAAEITPTKPSTDDNGVYQIGTAAQLYWFAGLVCGTLEGVTQNRAANAVLTADITVNKDVLNAKGELNEGTFKEWTTIGNYSYPYRGAFDGQGHTVSGLYFNDSSASYVGLFGVVATSGSVSNVGVEDSYFNGDQNVGGVSGYNNGKITNCYNTATVSGSKYVGGMSGYDGAGGTIMNCYNTGAVSGSDYVGGVSGFGENLLGTISNCYNIGIVKGISNTACVVGYSLNGVVSNCYYSGDKSDDDIYVPIKPIEPISPSVPAITIPTLTVSTNTETNTSTQSSSDTTVEATKDENATCKTAEQFASGEVAYLLLSQGTDGEIWGQKIDTDPYPVLGGAKVYKLTKTYCDNTAATGYTYSNFYSDILHKEYDSNGFCTNCGEYQPAIYYKTANRYEISNAGQLYWFAGLVNGTLEDVAQDTAANAFLTADITVNTGVLKSDGTLAADASGFTSWTPIGWYDYDNDVDYSYTGKFDGQKHTISGLYFNNTSNTYYVGMFGFLGSGGEIKNVGVIDSYFNGYCFVGGVCGENGLGGTITGCYNTGTVSNSYKRAGGVCGASSGTITNCYNTGTVSGLTHVGGVCGTNAGTITSCYNTGAVSSTDDFVGGVCGYNNSEGTIISCYNKGTVSSTDDFVGGVCGYNLCKITNCYYDSDKYSGNAVGYNNGTVTDVEGRPTSDFTNGTVCGLVGYHSHKINGFCSLCKSDYEPAVFNEIDNCYEISNVSQLYWFADKVNNDYENYGSANAVLTADITVNTGVLKADGTLNTGTFTNWTPIGYYNSSSDYVYYLGTFDGQNHTISGLYFNDTSTSNVGLFGINKGTIKNVGVVDSYFSGSDSVGGVCGYNNSGTITDCYNTGTVSGSDNVGGVCGDNCGTITNCYNTGNVSGTGRYVGGVCGDNFLSSGTITNCYNTGEVSGSSWVGGVCGCNNFGAITNCYSDSNKYSGNAVGTNEGTVTDVEGKTVAQFASGEVAYLLSQGCTIDETTYNGSVWGQKIGTEDYPVLNGKKVLANVDCSAFANDIIVYGQSASLDGTIGFNIYVSADDSYEWDKTVNGVQGVEIENGLYKFTYQVAAKDMDEKINFTVNDKIDVTVSVSDYLAVLSKSDNESLKNLADSMSVYGDAAEAYFGGEAVAEQTVTYDLSVYDFTVGTMPEGISYYGSSLILKSETTIRHYFKLAEGKEISDYTFSVDGTTVTPIEKQGYYCIDIENVRAEKLGTPFNVSVNGEEVITNYSALSYVNKALDSDLTDDNLKNLVKALYNYNRYALAYIAA